MKNNILKISRFGLEYINRKKRENIEELLSLKKIAENPYDKMHEEAEFLLGLYGAYDILNMAQGTNKYGTKNNLKQLEQIWRE